jgi:hypothetical protein
VPIHVELDDGPVHESAFGGRISTEDEGPRDTERIDYYAVARQLKDKVDRQPSILVDEMLKDYQIKGL